MAAHSAPLALTLDQVRRWRVARSGLVEPFASPEAAAAAHVGIQAQILQAAGLALWNRTRGFDHARLDELLFTRRTLIKLWGQRHTLHLYPSADWPLLHGAATVRLTWWERMAEKGESGQLGGDYRHLVEQVAEALAATETMGRSDLRALDLDLHEDLYSGWGGIFADLVRLGYACHADRAGSEGRFAHRSRWLPDLAWSPPDTHTANVEMARRYFQTYGPATLHDLAYWRGATLAQARPWVEALGDALATVHAAGAPMLVPAADLPAFEALAATAHAADGLPVRLLFRFDPLLLAHRDKSWVVDERFKNRVWRPAGHIEGVLLHRGRAAATWRYDRKGSGLVVTLNPFKPLPKAVVERVPRQAEGVARFFALPIAEVRYEPA